MLGEISIRFPGPGININNLPTGFKIMGIEVTYKGLFVFLAMIVGFAAVMYEAYAAWHDIEMYLNLGIASIIAGIIGARICYIIYMWDYFKDNILQCFNILGGGGVMYGGIFAALIPCIIVAGKKKVPILQILDTMCIGLAIGQAVGFFGELFGRTGFGTYTDGFFSMQIKYDEVKGVVNHEIASNLTMYGGIEYIQVHPLFLYRAFGCMAVFLLLVIFKRLKKKDGDILLWYIAGYSAVNIFTEEFRVNATQIPGCAPTFTQLAAGIFLVSAVAIYIYRLLCERSKVSKQ